MDTMESVYMFVCLKTLQYKHYRHFKFHPMTKCYEPIEPIQDFPTSLENSLRCLNSTKNHIRQGKPMSVKSCITITLRLLVNLAFLFHLNQPKNLV